MKRNTKIVLIVACALALAAGILALLNSGNAAQKRAMQESGTFLIEANGQQYIVSMKDLQSLSPQKVQVNAKSSTTDYEKKQFTGISLKSLFDHLGVNDSTARSVSFTAVDGYASAISISDALDEENCFIVFEEDGKPLGTKESGGSGPYRMILAKENFSQRWCKFLLEIKVN